MNEGERSIKEDITPAGEAAPYYKVYAFAVCKVRTEGHARSPEEAIEEARGTARYLLETTGHREVGFLGAFDEFLVEKYGPGKVPEEDDADEAIWFEGDGRTRLDAIFKDAPQSPRIMLEDQADIRCTIGDKQFVVREVSIHGFEATATGDAEYLNFYAGAGQPGWHGPVQISGPRGQLRMLARRIYEAVGGLNHDE